jgi:hypothetical protein
MRRPPDASLPPEDARPLLQQLKASCGQPGGGRRVQTVAQSCSVPVAVMDDCRRRKVAFPDPHDWRPALSDAKGPWWRCATCGDVTRIGP